jgi:hypothetical protein
MLSKEERKARNLAFWSAFKEVMRKKMSSNGRRVNWATYPTEIKDTYLRLNVDGQKATVSYDIQFKDSGVRAIFWEQLGELRKVMEQHVIRPAEWREEVTQTDGTTISQIVWTLENVSFYRDEDWTEIHHFFRSVLIEFDAFYQEFKDILIALVD